MLKLQRDQETQARQGSQIQNPGDPEDHDIQARLHEEAINDHEERITEIIL